MTDAISVTELMKQQDALQKDYEKATGALQNAQGKYAEKKAILCKFNDKYGRVIAMMNED